MKTKHLEVSWVTVCEYLKEKNETAVPMCGSNDCVLVIKPGKGVELQLRGKSAAGTNVAKLPNLILLQYEIAKAKTYEYLAIKCEEKNIVDAVIKFYSAMANKFVLEKLPAEKAIGSSYAEWKDLLSLPIAPDPYTLNGLWGELYVISLALQNDKVDPHSLIQNWSGPLGYANDFSFGNNAIEIKTTTKQSNIVEISSLGQLDAKIAWLTIVHAFHAFSGDGGKSMGSLIKEINLRLDFSSVTLFEGRVDSALKTIPLPNAIDHSMKTNQLPLVVAIDEKIPLLTRSQINKWLGWDSAAFLLKAKYELDFSKFIPKIAPSIGNLFEKLQADGYKDE